MTVEEAYSKRRGAADKVKRSKISAIIFLGLVLVPVGYYYLDTYLPQHTDSDKDGWTDWDETRTYHTDPHTPNPNARYFVDKGGTVELLKRILVLDADGKTDPQRREFIDYLFSPNLSKLPSSQLAKVRTQCIDQILKDGKVTAEEASSLHLLSQYSPETQLRYTDIGEDVVKYLHTLTLVKDRSFVDYAIQNKLRMENGTLTDSDINFLLEPGKCARNVFEVDLRKLATLRPDIAAELRKIPDFETVGVKQVEANEDIVYAILRSKNSSVVGGNLDRILSEGIRDKIKYDSALQALVWHFVDNEPYENNPLGSSNFDLSGFVESVWRKSSTSGNFGSDRWKNFDEVVDRLNSVTLIDVFMKPNFQYDTNFPAGYLPSAVEVFNRRDRNGFIFVNCRGNAMFGAYCLVKNGYEAYYFGVNPYGPYDRPGKEGHAVTLFKDPGTRLLYLFDNLGGITWDGHRYRRMGGPYRSYEDAASSIGGVQPWGEYHVIDMNGRIVTYRVIWT